MKYRLVDLLVSVPSGECLRVENAQTQNVPFNRELHDVPCKRFCAFKNCWIESEQISPADCRECYTQEIVEGELVSDSGERFPIYQGIPRLFSTETAGWLKKNQETFSLEWKMFRFGERNWGQDIEFRKRLFLKALGKNPDELKRKLIFDAGCGSGLLSMEMANSFGMEVVALDLARGIEQAYCKNDNPFVYFIQGSVLEPPMKEESVDFIYCAGVLVALPDPKAGFKVLKPRLKKGGRYFIWMYHPIDDRHHPNDKIKVLLYNWIRVNITSRLPIGVQYLLFLSMAPLFLLKKSFFNLFRNVKDARTWREKTQALVDMFSPVYQHRFTEEEIVDWFRAEGFSNAEVSYTEAYGFGVRGDLMSATPKKKLIVNNRNEIKMTY